MGMQANIGFYSYGTAALAYALLAAFAIISRHHRPMAMPLFAASLLTALWAAVIAGSTLLEYPQVQLMQLGEVARNAGWWLLLLHTITALTRDSDRPLTTRNWLPWFMLALAAVLASLFVAPLLVPEAPNDIAYATWLAMAIVGLLLLEQILRNSSEQERWSHKFLCLGLGIVFAYDFFMYAEALLFRQLIPSVWQARGIVVAMGALLLAVATRRGSRDPGLRVSRHVVFHSVTLLAAGFYLLAMAAVGYFIRYLGGSWSGVLQIVFLCASGLLLLTLLFSGQIRARTRVWLSKHFFSYKYDYRNEWLRFTDTLAEGADNIPESIICALAQLGQSAGGLLWARDENGHFRLLESWQMTEPDQNTGLGALPAWLAQSGWIINLREWRESPDIYGDLQIPQVILDAPRAGLLIPLMYGNQLVGVLLLRESDLQHDINWEDRDLLKMAGRQAASHLAQYQASQALVEARQFEAFNRLSAYVIHDLKNVLAQQSLIVSNAQKHRHNPQFMDDVIATVENSVQRMTRLMEQMRSGERGGQSQSVPLCALLHEVVQLRQHDTPLPQLTHCDTELRVQADREQLATVFNHIVQNAQEATAATGRVQLRLERRGQQAVLEVSDNGCGMDEDFLRQRLFKPFDSTKGLTGMGIGAFESREFVRGLGGDILVQSAPGEGTTFTIVLPCVASTDEDEAPCQTREKADSE